MSRTTVTNSGVSKALQIEGSGYAFRTQLATFQVGSGVGDHADPTATGIIGSLVDSGDTSRMTVTQLNANSLLCRIQFDYSLGDFDIGNIGIFDDTGTLFALLVYGKTRPKVRQSLPLEFGNSFTVDFVLVYDNLASVVAVLPSSEGADLPTVSTVESLPNPLTSTHSLYIVQSNSLLGNRPSLAYLNAGIWIYTPLDGSGGGGGGDSGTAIGGWNAATNSPVLADSNYPPKGAYYTVTTSGSTVLGGNSVWNVGDRVSSTGTSWVRIANVPISAINVLFNPPPGVSFLDVQNALTGLFATKVDKSQLAAPFHYIFSVAKGNLVAGQTTFAIPGGYGASTVQVNFSNALLNGDQFSAINGSSVTITGVTVDANSVIEISGFRFAQSQVSAYYASPVPNRKTFSTAQGNLVDGQTTFTLPGGYQPGTVWVNQGGWILPSSKFTATDGSTVVITGEAVSSDDEIEIGGFVPANTISPGPGEGGGSTTPATKYDVGLGNVDNTSDAQKVASGPIASALAAKLDAGGALMDSGLY